MYDENVRLEVENSRKTSAFELKHILATLGAGAILVIIFLVLYHFLK